MGKLTEIEAERAVAALLQHAREFHAMGWMWGTSGNLSVKLDERPVTIAISGSGASKGEMAFGDIAVTPAERRAQFPWLGEGRRKPSAETIIHQAIYERLPDSGAVYHVHTVASTALSLEAARLGPKVSIDVHGLEMLKGWDVPWRGGKIAASIPVIPNHERMDVLADGFAKLIKQGLDAPIIVVAGHGITVWGKTPEETRNRIEIAEFIFQTLWEQAKARLTEKNFTLRGAKRKS
jgi:methylthioribulose-1-phosphate dehydratase